MSNIRMLRNILKNVVRNVDDKTKFRRIYTDAKQDLDKMHELRSIFDPSYEDFDKNLINTYNTNKSSIIDNYDTKLSDDAFEKYLDNAMGFNNSDDYINNVEEFIDKYPLYRKNKNNIDYSDYYHENFNELEKALYEGIENDSPLTPRQQMNRHLYDRWYGKTDYDSAIDSYRRALDTDYLHDETEIEYMLKKLLGTFGEIK